jgi:hypothetical protein
MGTHPEGESCEVVTPGYSLLPQKGSAHFSQALPESISFEAQ